MDRVNSCPELDYAHTPSWCGYCWEKEQSQRNQSRIANALDRLADIISTEEGKLEMNITRQQRLNIPPRPKDDKPKYKGVDL